MVKQIIKIHTVLSLASVSVSPPPPAPRPNPSLLPGPCPLSCNESFGGYNLTKVLDRLLYNLWGRLRRGMKENLAEKLIAGPERETRSNTLLRVGGSWQAWAERKVMAMSLNWRGCSYQRSKLPFVLPQGVSKGHAWIQKAGLRARLPIRLRTQGSPKERGCMFISEQAPGLITWKKCHCV